MGEEILRRTVTELDGNEVGIFDYRAFEIADWLLTTDKKELNKYFEDNPIEKSVMIQFGKMFYDFAIELDKAIND